MKNFVSKNYTVILTGIQLALLIIIFLMVSWTRQVSKENMELHKQVDNLKEQIEIERMRFDSCVADMTGCFEGRE